MASRTTNRFSPEVRTRAVGLVFEHEKAHSSRRATVTSIAAKIGRTAQSLNGGSRRRRSTAACVAAFRQKSPNV